MNWQDDIGGGFKLTVPVIYHERKRGEYKIYIMKRPPYCDRGDWDIIVDGHNDLDGQDGFPRYFCGSADEAKEQMERWLVRRKAYHDYKRIVTDTKSGSGEGYTISGVR